MKIFQGVGTHMYGFEFTQPPVKNAGSAQMDPTISTVDNWKTSCIITFHLMDSIRVRSEFRSGDHTMLLKVGMKDIQCRNKLTSQQVLVEVVGTLMVLM